MRQMLIICSFFLVLVQTAMAQDAPVEAVVVAASGNRQLRLAVETPAERAGGGDAGASAAEMADVIVYDAAMCGLFSVEKFPSLSPAGLHETSFLPWASSGVALLVRGEVTVKGDELTAEFRLYDVSGHTMLTARRYLGALKDKRRFAHDFSDEILRVMTGEKGPFTTHIAFVSNSSGNKEIAIMEWDGRNQMQLTRNGSINLNPDFSPDGRELVFSSYKRGNPDLYRRALSSTAEIPVSNRKGLNITGAWSPDGSRIALTLSKDGDSEIYALARDGSSPVRLTVNPAIDVAPAWSPDGGRIAFVSDRLGKPQIFVMNADGGNVRRLTTSGSYNVSPRWSPKGDRIAYARMSGGSFQIFGINSDGTGDTQLTETGSNENPAWSPDGRFIAFSSKRGGTEAIYVMRADGSGQTRITQSKGSCTQPAWSRQ